MFPSPFAYHDPRTLDEALALLAAHGADAKLLAGGQSLLAAMNLGLAQPARIIDLHRVAGLDGVRADDGAITLGAMVRHRALETSALLRRVCPLLAETAALIGNARVRARGTLGGSLAHADPAAELPAALLALDAQLRLRGPRGERLVAARAFFLGPLTTALDPDELLLEARLPTPQPASGFAFEEVARRPGDFAIVGAAALVTLAADGACRDVRLAFCGVGDTPLRAGAAEARLAGAVPAATAIEEAARAAAAEIEPAADPLASRAYRRHLARVVAGRALERAAERARRATGVAR